jgi:hypothetical protein
MWRAIGWTMLHFLWVGGLIGILAATALRALRGATPELRYGVALGALTLLALAPAAIGWRAGLVDGTDRPSGKPEARTMPEMPPPPGLAVEGARTIVVPTEPVGLPIGPAPIAGPGRTAAAPRPWRLAAILDAMAARLPWLWLVGSPITFAWLALGLAGAERLCRRAAVADGELSSTVSGWPGSWASPAR